MIGSGKSIMTAAKPEILCLIVQTRSYNRKLHAHTFVSWAYSRTMGLVGTLYHVTGTQVQDGGDKTGTIYN